MKKTNGDSSESSRLISEIKLLIEGMGWSQNRAAAVIYYAEHDTDCDVEVSAFQESFKKQIQRHSTPVKRLQRYLEILARDEQVRKSGRILNSYIPSGVLDEELVKDLELLSSEISKRLQSEAEE
ncbi:MAG: hypothetical protein ACTJHW_10470 [Paenalcaligenes sp.]